MNVSYKTVFHWWQAGRLDADYDIRDLQQEAERNGYILDWTFEYFCNKMTPEEWKQYLEWE